MLRVRLGNMKNGSGSKQIWINEWVKYDRREGKIQFKKLGNFKTI